MNVYLGSFPRSGSHIISLMISKIFEINVKKENMAIEEDFYGEYPISNGLMTLSHEPIETPKEFTHAILLIRNPLEAILRHNELDLIYLKSVGDKYETSHTKEKFIPSYLLLINEFNELKIPKKVVYYEDFMTDFEGFIKSISSFLGKQILNQPQQMYEMYSQQTKENHLFSSKFEVFDPKQHSKHIPEEKLKIYKESFEGVEILKKYFQ